MITEKICIPKRQSLQRLPIGRRGSKLWRLQHTAGPGLLHGLSQDIRQPWLQISHSFQCTCDGNFPGLIFDGCKVGRSPGAGNDDEEEGGGDEAVEDQDQEDQHVVRLEIWRLVIGSGGKKQDLKFTRDVVLGSGALQHSCIDKGYCCFPIALLH